MFITTAKPSAMTRPDLPAEHVADDEQQAAQRGQQHGGLECVTHVVIS